MRNLGLERIEVPSDWSKVLEEAWIKRALLWLGQPEADRGVALQLAERRAGPQVPKALPALGWRVWELNPQAQGIYERAFISHGGTLTSQGEPDPENRLRVAAARRKPAASSELHPRKPKASGWTPSAPCPWTS